MGHRAHAYGVRVGKLFPWKICSQNTWVLNRSVVKPVIIHNFVKNFFMVGFAADFQLLYSHCELVYYSERLSVNVFLFDGISAKLFGLERDALGFLLRKKRGDKKEVAFVESSVRTVFSSLLGVRFERCVRSLQRYFVKFKYNCIAVILQWQLVHLVQAPQQVSVNIYNITKWNPTVFLLGHYIFARLRDRYTLGEASGEVVKSLRRLLNKGVGLSGFRLQCDGRFTRADRAVNLKYFFGRVPLNTMSARIEFASMSDVLRYGVGGVKVWLYWQRKPVRHLDLLARVVSK